MSARESLTAIGERHGTNKTRESVKRRPLTQIYELYLAGRRDEALTIVEFGVEAGGSVRMWRDFFPRAQVIGVDVVADRVQYADDAITILIGDQKDPKILAQIAQRGPIDLVVDDGSHRAEEQQACLLALWPHLAPDGIYVVEDIHTSYREKYGMAWRQPGTTVELIKDLVDDVHEKVHKQPVTLPDLEYLHVYMTTCVLKRRGPRLLLDER